MDIRRFYFAKHPLLVQCYVTTVWHDALIGQGCCLWACLQGRDGSPDDLNTIFFTLIIEILPQEKETRDVREEEVDCQG